VRLRCSKASTGGRLRSILRSKWLFVDPGGAVSKRAVFHTTDRRAPTRQNRSRCCHPSAAFSFKAVAAIQRSVSFRPDGASFAGKRWADTASNPPVFCPRVRSGFSKKPVPRASPPPPTPEVTVSNKCDTPAPSCLKPRCRRPVHQPLYPFFAPGGRSPIAPASNPSPAVPNVLKCSPRDGGAAPQRECFRQPAARPNRRSHDRVQTLNRGVAIGQALLKQGHGCFSTAPSALRATTLGRSGRSASALVRCMPSAAPSPGIPWTPSRPRTSPSRQANCVNRARPPGLASANRLLVPPPPNQSQRKPGTPRISTVFETGKPNRRPRFGRTPRMAVCRYHLGPAASFGRTKGVFAHQPIPTLLWLLRTPTAAALICGEYATQRPPSLTGRVGRPPTPSLPSLPILHLYLQRCISFAFLHCSPRLRFCLGCSAAPYEVWILGGMSYGRVV